MNWFKKAFGWHRHEWSTWSNPIDAEQSWAFGRQVNEVMVQVRKCSTCGKIEIGVIR